MIDENFLISGATGLGAGLLLSIVFGIYNRKTADSTSRTIFGISSNSFITQVFLSILSVIIVFLSTMCVLVRDGKYPSENPIRFTLETLAMGLIPSALFMGIIYSRMGGFNSTAFVEFLVITLKCGIGHVLLQYSGYYTYMFA
jgi:hypothetical protein